MDVWSKMADAFQQLQEERRKEEKEKRERDKIEENKAIADWAIKMGLIEGPQTQPEVPESQRGKPKESFNRSQMAEEELEVEEPQEEEPVYLLGNHDMVPKGRTYTREVPTRVKMDPTIDKIGFNPGYLELLDLVAGLQKDARRIQDCVTKAGAEEWLKKTKRKDWTVYEEDITGSVRGQPDGIKEVLVCDKKGNLRVVNGWTIKKSDFPTRRAYRTAYTTQEQRKKYPWTSFKQDTRRVLPKVIKDKDGNSHFRYVNELSEVGDEFKNVQQAISPRNCYKAFVVKPVYDKYRDAIKRKYPKEALKQAHLFNTLLRLGYQKDISFPALREIFNTLDLSTIEPKQIQKAERGRDYLQKCVDYVKELLYDAHNLQEAQDRIENGLKEYLA